MTSTRTRLPPFQSSIALPVGTTRSAFLPRLGLKAYQISPQGQRVQLTVNDGAEFEDIYAHSPPESTRRNPRMVQKKIGSTDTMNGSGKRQSAMPYPRGNMNKSHNGMVAREHPRRDNPMADDPQGNRPGFQTDSSISSGRLGDRRELQRWDGGDSSSNGLLEGGIEDSADSNKPWDQFAVNAEKFGVQTDYNENIYTTSINRNDPGYKEKVARAERLARKIEGSTATSSHAAEERVVDHVGAAEDGVDEEEKYVLYRTCQILLLTIPQVQRCQAWRLPTTEQPEHKQIHAAGTASSDWIGNRKRRAGRSGYHLITAASARCQADDPKAGRSKEPHPKRKRKQGARGPKGRFEARRDRQGGGQARRWCSKGSVRLQGSSRKAYFCFTVVCRCWTKRLGCGQGEPAY